jgi:hypothetical protein
LSVWLAAKDALSYTCPVQAVNRLAIPATGERILGILSDRQTAVPTVDERPAALRDASVLAGGDQPPK